MWRKFLCQLAYNTCDLMLFGRNVVPGGISGSHQVVIVLDDFTGRDETAIAVISLGDNGVFAGMARLVAVLY